VQPRDHPLLALIPAPLSRSTEDTRGQIVPVASSEAEGLIAVRALVQAYTSGREHYRSAAYDELSTRTSFIDRLFEALGWNVTNTGPDREVVFHNRHRIESTVAGPEDWDEDLTQEEIDERASHTDVLDYLFQYNRQPLFCVEAKRPHVGINGRGSAQGSVTSSIGTGLTDVTEMS